MTSLPSAGSVKSALLALGATAVATQIVLLREFLSIFQGNELVIGIVLAWWLILTGLGSFLGRSAHRFAAWPPATPVTLLALGLTPVITVIALRGLRNLVFATGTMVPIVQAFLSSSIALAPFCLTSGFSFALLAAELAGRETRNPAAAAYVWESLGSAMAGLIVTLILLPYLETFQILALFLAVTSGMAYLHAVRFRVRILSLAAALGLIAGVLLVPGIGDLDLVTRRLLFPGQQILFFKDTPYGNLTVTRQEEQISVFENGVLMFSTNDIQANEENVHYALAQHPDPKNVLLIGGGIAGTTREILKYGVQLVDYAELNPWVLQIGRIYTDALDDPRIHAITDDGRRFVRTTGSRYDVALINLPDPQTIQLNRFYTVEFFRELKEVLFEGGVVSISLLPAAEYQGPEARRSSSTLLATLRRCFAHVLMVPGMRNYFLASDRRLDIGIGQLIEARNVPTTYVNRYYLDDRLLRQRSADLMRSLDSAARVNTDFEPISYYRQLDYWLSYFGGVPAVWILLVAAAVALLMWRFSAVGVGIFTGGFIGVSLEILLLLVFQTLSGSLYYMTGVIIAVFMAGLAAGSWTGRQFLPKARMGTFAGLQLAVAVACIMLPPLFALVRDAGPSAVAVQMVFAGLGFSLAILFGLEFAVASSLRTGAAAATASELYGLDLAGSALGALMISVYAVPVLGVADVCKLLAWASAGAAAVCLVMARRA